MRYCSLFIFILCFSFLSKAAENPDIHMEKGRDLLYNNNGEEAYRNFMKAHELQSKDADLYLGLSLFFGIGTNEDRPLAISYMEKASEHGDQSIDILLGFCYYYGLYVERDEAKAFHYWIEKGQSHNQDFRILIGISLFTEKPRISTVSGHVVAKENFRPVMDYIHSAELSIKHYNRIWMQKDKYGNLWVDYSVRWLIGPTIDRKGKKDKKKDEMGSVYSISKKELKELKLKEENTVDIIKNMKSIEAYCFDQGVLNIIEGDSTFFESCSDTTIIERQWETPSNVFDAMPLEDCGGIGILKDGHFYIVDKKSWSLGVSSFDITSSYMMPKGQPIPSWLKSKIYEFMSSYLYRWNIK